mgnify:CR=1 FL=1
MFEVRVRSSRFSSSSADPPFVRRLVRRYRPSSARFQHITTGHSSPKISSVIGRKTSSLGLGKPYNPWRSQLPKNTSVIGQKSSSEPSPANPPSTV